MFDPVYVPSGVSEPANFVLNQNDCNDENENINPDAIEIKDEIDNNCDNQVDEFANDPDTDFDGDGYTINQGDCNDEDEDINPDAYEIYDQIDNDCDGEVDEFENDPDADYDRDGYTINQRDCNDQDENINPAENEILCNGIDDDCDGDYDDDRNMDGDPYSICDGDCDDNNRYAYPGADEILCNQIDENCNGLDDDDTDTDGDLYSICEGDCDDTDNSIHPGATEICNGLDDNCNSQVDDGQSSIMCPLTSNVLITSCASAEQQCIIAVCQAGWYDMDGVYENGCECEITGVYNNSFDNATDLGEISDEGGQNSASGVLLPSVDAYYSILVVDDLNGIFNPHLEVLSDNSLYSFTAYRENHDEIETIFSGELDMSYDIPLYDDTEKFFIKVSRINSNQPTCESFSFRIFED
ncbi:MAG: hypothetical protein AMS23_05340 [Bacteroides sp. SM1_62]|nr:MAG: hypothetical protein AMS23_05340 [Bacteroides sp. SM1_62]